MDGKHDDETSEGDSRKEVSAVSRGKERVRMLVEQWL